MRKIKKIKRHLCRLIINTFFCGTRFFKIKVFLLRLCNIKVGQNTKIVGPILFGNSIDITIGDNCWIGRNLNIDGNGSVIIDDNVDIAPHVVINTGGHKIGDSIRRAGEGLINHIYIKRGTWIGTKVTIINNITIGSGVVIAAGSLVKDSINDNIMVAGVPAIKKKQLQ